MTYRLLAVDWGSTSLRGALLDEAGAVLAERSAARGMLSIAPGGFAEVFEQHFADWMDVPGTRCLMAGMVGSKQGWAEAAYCPCPAGLAEIAAALRPLGPLAGAGRRIAIVPGVSCEREGVPDVMRGEETQVFGALELLGVHDGSFVLPGTHSKWVSVEAGRIVALTTMMSGEFYDLLRRHSILARSLGPADAPHAPDDAAFDRGVRAALHGGSLMQTAFGVRALALFDRMAAGALASYLSGLVIGEELRCRGLPAGASVVVIGAPALARRFERALRLQGVAATVLGDAAAWRGLHTIDARARALSPLRE
ncbi:MAG: 2-dehydro-3-deoxygalactonokinase [Caldimonas sp.]